MFRDHRDDEGMDRILAGMDDRDRRMPLYITGSLIAWRSSNRLAKNC